MFIENDKVEKITTFSDMLYRDIALRTDSLAFYDNCIGRKNKTNLKNLLKHNLIYNADMDISDRYIKLFYENFDPDINYKLHKCYMDIEVDLMPNGFNDKGYIGFPNEDISPVPINIITLIDSKMMNIYVFVVKNKMNNELIKVENKVNEINQRLIKEFGEDDAAFFNLIETNFYNSEEEAIIAFFNKVHEIDPDICAGWNIGFDILTLMNRLQKCLEKKVELKEKGIRAYDAMLDIVCDKKYLVQKNKNGEDIYITPKAYYKQNKDKPFVDRMDEFTVLDGIMWYDQMLLYANIRKLFAEKLY